MKKLKELAKHLKQTITVKFESVEFTNHDVDLFFEQFNGQLNPGQKLWCTDLGDPDGLRDEVKIDFDTTVVTQIAKNKGGCELGYFGTTHTIEELLEGPADYRFVFPISAYHDAETSQLHLYLPARFYEFIRNLRQAEKAETTEMITTGDIKIDRDDLVIFNDHLYRQLEVERYNNITAEICCLQHIETGEIILAKYENLIEVDKVILNNLDLLTKFIKNQNP